MDTVSLGAPSEARWRRRHGAPCRGRWRCL